MLTRKALIVHCVTSPPLRHSACFGRTVAQRKRGTDWRMTLNLHLAKFSSRFLKCSRDRKDENVSLLWHFVVFLFLL